MSSEDSSEEFEVESICGHKIQDGKDYYLVKWKNYPPDDNTWEPVENLLNANELLEKYQNYNISIFGHGEHNCEFIGCSIRYNKLLFKILTNRRKFRTFNELKNLQLEEFGNFLELHTVYQKIGDKRIVNTKFEFKSENNQILKVFKTSIDTYIFLMKINNQEKIITLDEVKQKYKKEYVDFLGRNLVLRSSDEIN